MIQRTVVDGDVIFRAFRDVVRNIALSEVVNQALRKTPFAEDVPSIEDARKHRLVTIFDFIIKCRIVIEEKVYVIGVFL